MRAADVLVTAASTFSFTAAMLAHERAPPPPSSAPPGEDAPPARFWRPDPAAGALVEFAPWDAPVLLNACHSGTHFRRDGHSAGGGGVVTIG